MRVAFLPGTFRPDRCGVSHYTERLMGELARRGVECLVLTTHGAARHHGRPDVLGVTPDWGRALLAALPAELVRLRPDVLHIQHAAGSFGYRRPVLWLPTVLRAAVPRLRVAVTAHEYGWWEWHPRLLEWAWGRLGPWGEARALWDREDGTLLTGADVVIATHKAALQALLDRLPRLAPRIEHVPIGANIAEVAVDRGAARAALRQQYGWQADSFVFAYFGFLHPVKGLEVLLQAFQWLLAVRPWARLILAGGCQSLALDGEAGMNYEAGLRERIARADLEQAVRLTGYLSDEAVSAHLAGADAGVLPFTGGVTLKSGSLLAMWTHGLPVVATEPPAVEPPLRQASILVPRRDPDALAEALLRVIDDPGLRSDLAAKARAATAGFRWPAIAERHLRIYERLIGAGYRRCAWTVGA
ncbi:MAG: glycosyltransferase [Anaerolineae bacterium]|nr:glycosyltransferase [Anaerolineae bacterium]